MTNKGGLNQMANTTQGKASEPMTAEQIKNMRGVLSLTLGAYAYLMPDALVIRARDNLQKLADNLDAHAQGGEV